VLARSAPVPAWSAALLSLVLAVSAVVVAGGAAEWKLVLVPLCFALPGAVIAAGRPDVAIGWLMLAVALLIAGSALGAEWGEDATNPGAAWAVWWTDRFSAYAVPAATLALLLLPDGRLPSRRWRVLAAVLIGAQALVVTVFCLAGTTAAAPGSSLGGAAGGLPNPVGLLPASAEELAVAAEPLLLSAPMLLVVAGFWVRVRRNRDQRRPLVDVVLLAAVFVVVSVVGHAAWPGGADVLDVVGAAVLGAGVTAAVLRGRLPGLEVAVHHSVLYAVLTLLVASAYVAVVAVLAASDVSLPPWGQGILTGVIALTVLPVRGWLQAGLDRALYGDRRDPYAAVRRLDDRLSGSTSSADVLDGLATSAAGALRLPWVAVEMRARDAVEKAEHGTRPRRHREIVYETETAAGRLLAVTVAWPPGRSFTQADEELLAGLARQAARTADALLLAQALLESRHELVTAREQERARLRRDLHDELGPTLAGLVMQLAGLGEVLRESPEVAAGRVPLLEDAARSALEDVRRVSRSLRPPALDELGLAGALRDHAAKLGLTVDGDLPELPALPAAVEVAAYRIGAEALTNVARHAHAARAAMELRVADDALDVVVTDDGPGWSGDRVGVGVLSMRERAEEVGGRLRIESRPGAGTTVLASLPLGGGDRG